MTRVFLAGATGVLGRRALPLLVAAGHEVTAVARTEEKAARVRAAGAVPVTVDLFEPAAAKAAVEGHDVVVNLTTHIPSLARAGMPGAWKENERIRREVSANLVDASLAVGATRYVQEALAFVYVDAGDAWVDEDSPVDGGSFNQGVHVAEAQTARFTASSGPHGAGVVLRFGLFHGAESEQTRQAVSLARRGFALTLGRPGAYLAMIEVDDAATAVVAALGAPAGVYNVVDDEPLTRADYASALAGAVGRTKPLRLPPVVASKVGGSKTALLARSERVRNRRFQAAAGWSPACASAREAWAKVVRELDS
ncbi:MAG TPA: NAD(P)H-binding protein [Acidimicrobiales bacterium]|nr:NAD(P)H-binding protein [Acidimicrobiales bacterium]